jgi:hypothetical protein
MKYLLIETEGTLATREVQVLTTQQVDALSTSQVAALPASQVEQYTIPGLTLYQCVHQDGAVDYRTVEGALTTFAGGSGVVDANPSTPLWDTPEAPAVPEPVVASRIITKLEYMNRFHDDELANLYTAAKGVVQIEVWLEKFKVSEFIDLSDPRTVGGVQALEAAGIVGAGRANEILA